MRGMRYLLGLALCGLALTGARGEDKPAFFNGKDLTGWEGRKDAWKVVDGAIVGTTPESGLKVNTFLCTTAKYKDFEMSFQVKLKDGGGNSGVQIRSEAFGDKDQFRVKGAQADIGKGYWGSLYGEGTVGMMKQSSGDAIKKAVKDAEFNDYSIKCVGKHVTIKINGETMVDGDFDKMADDGIIALQLHVGPPMEVTFKNLKFTDLSKK
jgi:hypothetical protein